MIQRVESVPIDSLEIKEEVQEIYQLDDFYYEHLKNLGLDNSGDVLFKDEDLIDYKDQDDGSEFIDIRN
jgi:hypothetical protein